MSYTSQPIRVRYSDTDQMGYMHHSNYLRYFEIARLEWLTSLGVSYKEMEENGIWLPVVDASLQYKSPSYFDDQITVDVRLKEAPRATLSFDYELRNQDDVVVCLGATRLAFLNAKTGRPMRCPSDLYDCLSPFV